MIVPFTIDPDIFSAPPNSRVDFAKHKQLIRLWRNYGVLVIPGAGKSDSRIFKALQTSDQRIKALWTNCFKQCTQELENSSVDEALKKSEFNKELLNINYQKQLLQKVFSNTGLLSCFLFLLFLL